MVEIGSIVLDEHFKNSLEKSDCYSFYIARVKNPESDSWPFNRPQYPTESPSSEVSVPEFGLEEPCYSVFVFNGLDNEHNGNVFGGDAWRVANYLNAVGRHSGNSSYFPFPPEEVPGHLKNVGFDRLSEGDLFYFSDKGLKRDLEKKIDGKLPSLLYTSHF